MTIQRSSGRILSASLVLALAMSATAAAQGALARARTLYNQQKYDEAIAAAEEARKQGTGADQAALVAGRARLERYRRTSDPVDLAAAREALRSIRPAQLGSRDRIDLVIGLGQALFFADAFGAAAELFDVAWGRADILPPDDRARLMDWWASAVDRQAQQHAPADRSRFYRRLLERASAESQHNPASSSAAYWLAVSARGTGDLERAADAVRAAWVRSRGVSDEGAGLRTDVDRLMLQAIVPERARQTAGGTERQQEALATLTAEWEAFKQQWK